MPAIPAEIGGWLQGFYLLGTGSSRPDTATHIPRTHTHTRPLSLAMQCPAMFHDSVSKVITDARHSVACLQSEVEAQRSGVQTHPQLHSNFKASVGYLRAHLKKEKS